MVQMKGEVWTKHEIAASDLIINQVDEMKKYKKNFRQTKEFSKFIFDPEVVKL